LFCARIAGIVGGAAVAHADVEEPVRPELDHSAVMVRKRLGDDQDHAFARRRGHRIRERLVLGDHGRAVGLRV
jgi:hypothetical protein